MSAATAVAEIDFDSAIGTLAKRSLRMVPVFVVAPGRMVKARSAERWATMVNTRVAAHPIALPGTIAIVDSIAAAAAAVTVVAAADGASAADGYYFVGNAGSQCSEGLPDLASAPDWR